MFERIGRGWAMAKESGAVIKQHPTLLAFPVFSGIAFALLFGFASAALFVLSGGKIVDDVTTAVQDHQNNPVVYVVAFLFYFATSFIVVFFNTALVSCALDAFAGRKPTVSRGLGVAFSRIPQIAGWSLIAATIGLFLNVVQGLLRDKLGIIGSILGAIVQASWAVVTYFVVPVLAVEGLGPIKAVKRSTSILRRTWGEYAGGEGGIGLIVLLLILPLFVIVPLAFVAGPLAVIVIPIVVLYVLLISVVSSALSMIFRSATYVYATTGQAPTSMNPALLQGTFRPK